MNILDNDTTIIMHKEIDLIQSCITRMANNSFLLKGWLVSLITVFITFIPKKFLLNIKFIYLLVIGLIICFWYLDGFYLKLERLYRRKYEWIITQRPIGNFEYLYDLNPYNENMWLKPDLCINIFCSIFSKTLFPFYGITILMSVILLLNL